MFLKNASAVLCTFLSVNFCLAQSSFKGVVKDSANNPITGASVQLKPTLLTTVTDKDGNFSFGEVKSGDYDLIITSVGYEKLTEKIKLESSALKNYVLAKKSYIVDEVIISSTRANENSVIAYNTISKTEIEQNNLGKDVPALLDQLPGVVITSDAGAGIGYSGLRIRGSDATRVNVTINGIPVNDAESQGMYWVDMPDLLSSVEDIQVQRGVGTSTNGAAAFGGSVNVLTDKLQIEPYAETSIGYGSFNTQKANIKVGSGLISNKFAFDVRLSKIKSNGYIDRASSDLKSFMFSGGYYGKKSLIKLVMFSGKEITYQSWYGTPESRIKNNEPAMQDYIMRNYLDEQEAENLLQSGRTYNYYTYADQKDDYRQDNYQLHFSHELSNKLILNGALHFTRGIGFYEEYKKNQSLAEYGISNLIINDTTISETNLVRRKWLDNYFYGVTYSLKYAVKKLAITLGGAWNRYDGDHYGTIIWAQYASDAIKDHQYYFNNGLKTDYNVFVKAEYALATKLSAWVDLQYRTVGYNFDGFNGSLAVVPQKVNYNFFNPKMGITYRRNGNETAYASISMGNKEPSRDDFTDSSPTSRPTFENLTDIEAGYNITSRKLAAGINFYYMLYKDQLVLTGQVNDVGNYTRTNVKDSYRRGVEMQVRYEVLKQFKLGGNLSLSENKIENFNYYLDSYDVDFNYTGQHQKTFSKTDIAFSPSVVASLNITFEPITDLKFIATEKYVGKQFLDNTADDAKSLEAFSYTNLSLNYILKLKGFKQIVFSFSVYNLFNQLYESNGYTYGYKYDNTVVNENFYYPQAGTNFLGQVTLKF